MKNFKRKRGGKVLTKEEIKEIKAKRKKLRKDLRKNGIKGIKDFESTAASMGYYFDTGKFIPNLLWFMSGKTLLSLLGASTLLLGSLFLASLVSEMQGHFTINLTDSMKNSGFSLSETADFENSTSRLYYDGTHTYTCVSFADIEAQLDLDAEGMVENGTFFQYTFYIRNEGDTPVDYEWQVIINSESQELSQACWFMIFADDEMVFYAQANEDGESEAIPEFDDDSRGYLVAPMYDYALYPEEQYEVIYGTTISEYYRVIPVSFISDTIVAKGLVESAELLDAHKYTVVMWLEGDDPDCIDDIIGGHLGAEMQFNLVSEDDESGDSLIIDEDEGMFDSFGNWWSDFISSFF